MSAAKKEFTAQELNPLASLDQWEDAVLERYPEPGVPAKSKEEFRNYEDPARDTVREFYKLNHTYQTYDFVLEKKADYLKFDKKEMPVWNAFDFLGAQEVIGMVASGAKYGIMTVHFYWVGAIFAMVFLGVFMMPFYYGSRARSVPEYLSLRFDEKNERIECDFLRCNDRFLLRYFIVCTCKDARDHTALGFRYFNLGRCWHCDDLYLPGRINECRLQ